MLIHNLIFCILVQTVSPSFILKVIMKFFLRMPFGHLDSCNKNLARKLTKNLLCNKPHPSYAAQRSRKK